MQNNKCYYLEYISTKLNDNILGYSYDSGVISNVTNINIGFV